MERESKRDVRTQHRDTLVEKRDGGKSYRKEKGGYKDGEYTPRKRKEGQTSRGSSDDYRRGKRDEDVSPRRGKGKHGKDDELSPISGDESIEESDYSEHEHRLKLPTINSHVHGTNVSDSGCDSIEDPDDEGDSDDQRHKGRHRRAKSSERKREPEHLPSIDAQHPSKSTRAKGKGANSYESIQRRNKRLERKQREIKVEDNDQSEEEIEGHDRRTHEDKVLSKAKVKHEKTSEDRTVASEKSSSMYEDYPLLRYVQENVIGTDLVIPTPFGQREVVYCDYTASGRSLTFIEDYIRDHVLPTYANTHSTTGFNARQTGKFREEARTIIKRCVNANKDDVVIFTGSGATAGINKLAWALKLNNPRVAMETAVFIGPYEHHSNILIWRELGAKVVRIRQELDTGHIDLEHLKSELQFWKEKRRQLLVTMSAASNVSGIITDADAVCRIAHQHGALAFFDYAAGAPYLKIDMNPKREEYKDAIILSPHKFVGGPGTPGLVIAKKWLFRNNVPDRVGGGTVRFVTREQHAYVGNIEEKEEGGTPAIIESIRAGMVFRLKERIGSDVIEAREEELCNRAFAVWEKNPNIYVMGSHTAHRVPIFSFLTKHEETGRLVHHNFISTVLSDLYGIQARGGCACAGPYAEDLMGISEPIAKKYMWFLSEKKQMREKGSSVPAMHMEIMKPGFTRINLVYFYDDETVDFVIQAVDDVTRYGWKLLPQYTFDVRTGSWHHKSFANSPLSELESLDQFDPAKYAHEEHQREGKSDAVDFQEVLRRAREIYDEVDIKSKPRPSSASLVLREALPHDKRNLKWFLTPHDAALILADKQHEYLEKKKYRLPFQLMPIRPRTDTERDSAYQSDNESKGESLEDAYQQGRNGKQREARESKYNRRDKNKGKQELKLPEISPNKQNRHVARRLPEFGSDEEDVDYSSQRRQHKYDR